MGPGQRARSLGWGTVTKPLDGRAMRVLVVTQVFPPMRGGSGQWLFELYRRFASIDVHVAAGSVEGASTFDREATLPITRLPMTFKSWGVGRIRGCADYARLSVALNRVIREYRPDTIHCGKCLPEGL